MHFDETVGLFQRQTVVGKMFLSNVLLQQGHVADKNYLDVGEFLQSGDGSLYIRCGAIVAPHRVQSDPHQMLFPDVHKRTSHVMATLRAHDMSRHAIAAVLAFAELRSLQIPLSLAAASA